MNPLLLIPIVWVIGLPIALAVRAMRAEKETKTEEAVAYPLDGYEVKGRYGVGGVCAILRSALRSLEKQHAAGYRNWISCCVERSRKGMEVPPEVALRALYMTRDELTGGRFDLEGLNEAIAALEETGEGE